MNKPVATTDPWAPWRPNAPYSRETSHTRPLLVLVLCLVLPVTPLRPSSRRRADGVCACVGRERVTRGVSRLCAWTTSRERFPTPVAKRFSRIGCQKHSVQTASDLGAEPRFYHDSEVLAR